MQPDGGAQAAGGDRHVQGVAAGAGDVVRRRPSRTGVGPRHRQEVDHQLTEDARTSESGTGEH